MFLAAAAEALGLERLSASAACKASQYKDGCVAIIEDATECGVHEVQHTRLCSLADCAGRKQHQRQKAYADLGPATCPAAILLPWQSPASCSTAAATGPASSELCSETRRLSPASSIAMVHAAPDKAAATITAWPAAAAPAAEPCALLAQAMVTALPAGDLTVRCTASTKAVQAV